MRIFHSLRHAYVSLHAEAGTPQAMIQANVGHSNPSMTAYYTHVGGEAAFKAAQVLNLSDPSDDKDLRSEKVLEHEKQIEDLLSLTETITGKRNEDVRARLLAGLKELSEPQ